MWFIADSHYCAQSVGGNWNGSIRSAASSIAQDEPGGLVGVDEAAAGRSPSISAPCIRSPANLHALFLNICLFAD